MKKNKVARSADILRNSRGISLTEVLVSLVVLSVGALGNAALHAAFMKTRNTTLFRLQAANVAADIVERIRANPSGRREYEFDSAAHFVNGSSVSCPSKGGFDSNTCARKERAMNDLSQWNNLVSMALTPDTARSIHYDDSAGTATYTITLLRGSHDLDGNDLIYSIRFQP